MHATIANQQNLEIFGSLLQSGVTRKYTSKMNECPLFWGDYFKRRWIIFQPSILIGDSLVFRVMLSHVTSTMAFNRCRSQWWGKLGQKRLRKQLLQGGTCWFVAAWMLSSLMWVIGVTGTRRPLKPDSRGDWSLPSKSWVGRYPLVFPNISWLEYPHFQIRKYIFHPGLFFVAMLVYWSVTLVLNFRFFGSENDDNHRKTTQWICGLLGNL